MKKDLLHFHHQKIWLDYSLLFFVLGLSFFGLITIYNISAVESAKVFQDKYYYLKNQSLWLLIGLGLMFFFSKVPYQKLKIVAPFLFFINIILLILVFFPGIGIELKGAKRWINLIFFNLQPSELLKLTLTIYLSSWLEKPRRFSHFLLIIGLISILIGLQPDMGTLTVVVISAFIINFLSGTSLWKILFLSISGIITGLLMIFTSTYRKNRLLTFFNPNLDPLGSSYHIRQVLIALGSGGIFGMGFGQSRQKFHFLPEVTTDSIFAVIAEETGFIGASILIIALLMLVLRGLRISHRAKNKFGRLLGTGITSMIGVQALINLGAMVALIPLTGVPLPFISYGGSSLIVSFIGIGILMNIGKNK